MKARARALLERAARKTADAEGGFADDLDGLADELVLSEDYVKAADLGRKAVARYGDRPVDPHALGQAQASFRRKYAADAVDRIALNVSDAVAEEIAGATEEASWLEDAIARVGDQIDAQESSATRYGYAPWSSGQSGYANQLGEFDVRFVWILDDDAAHCDDCPQLAAESAAEPWSIDTAPTYPGQGDTACLERCKCHIQADDETWAAAFP